MMFPYPSAEGLHVGNMYAFVGADIYGRWQAMHGYDVFEPMGFDAFGIHSENFAHQARLHPRADRPNIAHFRESNCSASAIASTGPRGHTTDPRYYRWTQWIFVQLFKAGLAERKQRTVNWCPQDQTVLADEQVIDGRCERCGTLVEQRKLEQWFLKITGYADRLLDNLETLDWSDAGQDAQRNWIGRSQGLAVRRCLSRAQPMSASRVFTTRPTPIFGVTFVALAPEHPLVERITRPRSGPAVAAYQSRRTVGLHAERGERAR